MIPDHSLYDSHYHDSKAPGSREAADAVLPIVCAVLDVTSIVDVGCGYGSWLAAARSLGIHDITGVEGPWAAEWQDRRVLETDFELILCDLEASFQFGRTFDLAVCIEVVEHLTAQRGPSFVADLCAASDAVLLGAAIPGQGGTNHVNERWTSEWAAEFADHGYRPLDCIRPRVWGDETLQPHHRQNPVLFVAEDMHSDAAARAAALSPPPVAALDVVHPWFLSRAQRPLGLRHLIGRIPHAARRSLQNRWQTRHRRP